MDVILQFFLMGIFLGFSAGISPGPLLAMTISETLQHGSKEGIMVAISPLFTDILIVSTILFILIRLKSQDLPIALISLSGAIYLMHLGVSSFKTKSSDIELRPSKKDSLRKGILVNFLSPHPYLFWITIGGPIIFRSMRVDILASVLFVLGFYALLIGSKVMLALFVGRSKSFLKSKYYLYTIRGLGFVYIIFALVFIKQGLELLDMYIL